jgi:hypothetical protein
VDYVVPWFGLWFTGFWVKFAGSFVCGFFCSQIETSASVKAETFGNVKNTRPLLWFIAHWWLHNQPLACVDLREAREVNTDCIRRQYINIY